jgi:hypothetical protein
MLGSGGRRAQKRIGVRAWRIAVLIPKRRAEPERRTGHGAAGQLRPAIPRWQQACPVRRNQLFGQSASRGFFERHVSYSKLSQSLCHARCAAESFSEVDDLAVPGRRRRIRLTMSQVRPRLTATQIRHPGSLLAESSISARASTFGSGVGSPLGARLVTSIRALRTTTWLRSRAGSTTCSPEGAGRAIPPVCDPAFQN